MHRLGIVALTAIVLAIPSLPAAAQFVATVRNEPEWRADNVPAAWPIFAKLPDAKPLSLKSARQVIDLSKSIIQRWDDYYADKTTKRPTGKESDFAIRYMLTIDPKVPEFPEAWGIFIRLRQVDQEMARADAPVRPSNRAGVVIGMTADKILQSNWGKPQRINETITARGKREQWVYGSGYLYLEDGILTSIQTSR